MNNLYVFDCFGVVVSDVSTLWMNKHFTPEQVKFAREKIYRNVDCGKLSFEVSFETLGEMSGMSPSEARKEWNTCLYPQQEVVNIIRKLRSLGQTTALLSNASQQYITYIFEQFYLNDLFDKTFVSANYGVAKPDKEFYEKCLGNLLDKYDEIYFTDDNPNNLIVPKKMGIKTLLFTSAEQLKKDLNL